MTTTITAKVLASNQDARNVSPNGAASINAITQHLGKLGSVDYWNGFRFAGVAIPQGETIVSATLDFYSAQTANGTLAKTIWYGEANDNANAYTTASPNKPENRPRTTASHAQDLDPSLWLAGLGYGVQTIDVKDLVQEIVNRVGWVNGNAMAFVGHDNGSSDDNYVALSTYDRAADRGAVLTVVYGTVVPPAVPTGLSVLNDNEYRNRLTWTDPNADATSFTIQRKTGVGGTYATIGTVPGNHNWFMDLTAAANTTYYYRVSTTNLGGTSAYGTEANVTTATGTAPWSAKVEAWLYPDSVANPETEYFDGRRIHTLRAEYMRVSVSGVVEILEASESNPYAYSTYNLAQLKAGTQKTTITIAGVYGNFAQILNDPTKFTNAITAIKNFAVTTDVDRMELDWEGYGVWNATDWTQFKAFCTALKTELNSVSCLLVVCGPPIPNSTFAGLYQWKYEQIISLVDFVTIMGYDYMFDYGAGTPVSPTAWVQSIAAWVMPRIGWANLSKVIWGMNSYGYQEADGLYDAVTILTYNEAQTKPGVETATKHPDADEMFWNNAGINYSYVRPVDMDNKRKVIEDLGFKTISVWHLGGNQWFAGSRAEIDGPASPVDPGDGPTGPDPGEELPTGIYYWDDYLGEWKPLIS